MGLAVGGAGWADAPRRRRGRSATAARRPPSGSNNGEKRVGDDEDAAVRRPSRSISSRSCVVVVVVEAVAQDGRAQVASSSGAPRLDGDVGAELAEQHRRRPWRRGAVGAGVVGPVAAGGGAADEDGDAEQHRDQGQPRDDGATLHVGCVASAAVVAARIRFGEGDEAAGLVGTGVEVAVPGPLEQEGRLAEGARRPRGVVVVTSRRARR